MLFPAFSCLSHASIFDAAVTVVAATAAAVVVSLIDGGCIRYW